MKTVRFHILKGSPFSKEDARAALRDMGFKQKDAIGTADTWEAKCSDDYAEHLEDCAIAKLWRSKVVFIMSGNE